MIQLPGTGLTAESLDPERADTLLDSLFAGGGLVLSQVATLTGLELHSVQNWVRRGFVSPPVNKRYSKRQVCRLILISMMKDSMEMSRITGILSYINGDLSDESDDTVGDDRLYLYLIALLAQAETDGESDWERLTREVTADYCEPREGAAERLRQVLRILYTAYQVSRMKRQIDAQVDAYLGEPEKPSIL